MTTPSSLTSAVHTIDKPTLALIRRVLCSHAPPSTPLEELLPALTSSPEVDLQLYALLAIVVRDYVYSWYGKITNDHQLVAEIIQVVAHVSREIESRLKQIDIELLLLDEIPALLDTHIKDYRHAQSRVGSSLTPHLTTPQIFHNLQPHPALSSPSSEPLYLKLLSTGILAVLLPIPSLTSPCERTLIRSILANTILSSTLEKLSEPYLIHSLLTKALHHLSPPRPAPPLLDTLLTLLTHTLTHARTLLVSLLHTLHTPPPPPHREKPLLRMSVFSLLPSYLRLSALQPWLLGNILLLSKPLITRTNRTGAVLDALLSEGARAAVCRREVVVEALRTARTTLFPGNGGMGPPKEGPGWEERERIRGQAEEALVECVPGLLKGVWFDDGGRGWAGEVLEVWSEKVCNKHLVYNILDLVVGRVLPELVERGPGEVVKVRMG